MFHNTVTTMLELVKFLTIRERRRFESISTSWEFIPNTNPGLPAMIALGHLWYNSGTHFAGPYRAAQSGTPDARMLRPSLPLGSVRSFPGRSAQQNGSRPELNYSASWSERVIRLAKWEACVQSCQKCPTMVQSLVSIDEITWVNPTIDSIRPRFTLPHGSFPR